jgi:hypothetical protein
MDYPTFAIDTPLGRVTFDVLDPSEPDIGTQGSGETAGPAVFIHTDGLVINRVAVNFTARMRWGMDHDTNAPTLYAQGRDTSWWVIRAQGRGDAPVGVRAKVRRHVAPAVARWLLEHPEAVAEAHRVRLTIDVEKAELQRCIALGRLIEANLDLERATDAAYRATSSHNQETPPPFQFSPYTPTLPTMRSLFGKYPEMREATQP